MVLASVIDKYESNPATVVDFPVPVVQTIAP
jgi:hypothetical protein